MAAADSSSTSTASGSAAAREPAGDKKPSKMVLVVYTMPGYLIGKSGHTEVPYDALVEEVKQAYEDREGMPVEEQILVVHHNAKKLEDGKRVVTDYNLSEYTRIFVHSNAEMLRKRAERERIAAAQKAAEAAAPVSAAGDSSAAPEHKVEM